MGGLGRLNINVYCWIVGLGGGGGLFEFCNVEDGMIWVDEKFVENFLLYLFEWRKIYNDMFK